MSPPSAQANLALVTRQTLRFWLLLIATGVTTGIAAGLLMRLLRAVQHLSWHYHTGRFLDAVAHAPLPRVFAVLGAAGVLIGLARLWLKRHRGSHGGEVNAAIWLEGGKLDVLQAVGGAVLSITGVGMGVALGREGAPKQAGAAAASLLADWTGLDTPQRCLLAACGAGAGMAAVYDVPLGGALFALEVLMGTLALPLVLPALAAAGIATATSWLLLPHAAVTYAVRFTAPPPPRLLLAAALAGPVLGVAASLYVRAIAWADTRRPRGAWQAVAPLPVLLVLAAAALRYPGLLGNGKDVVALALTGALPLATLGALLPLRVLATTACLASGAPGGLFTPTLTVGAVLGALLGYLLPGTPPALAALIGGGGFLAAATQGPVSTLVLLLELTQRIDPQTVPLLLAIAGATVTARLLGPCSIYNARLPVKRNS